jgi:hypothetical protein
MRHPAVRHPSMTGLISVCSGSGRLPRRAVVVVCDGVGGCAVVLMVRWASGIRRVLAVMRVVLDDRVGLSDSLSHAVGGVLLIRGVGRVVVVVVLVHGEPFHVRGFPRFGG